MDRSCPPSSKKTTKRNKFVSPRENGKPRMGRGNVSQKRGKAEKEKEMVIFPS